MPSVRQHTEPVALHEAVAGLLALSDERDGWLLRLRASWRAAYRLGFELGHAAGYRQAERDMTRSWREVATPVAHASGGELQRRRWAVRGQTRARETFAQPHPDDYPGQDGAA
jgi:hypothetical protein